MRNRRHFKLATIATLFVFTYMLVIQAGLIGASTVRAAIGLVYFSAIGENQRVRLVWETASEINTTGFFIQRSLQRESGYFRINPEIIPAEGSAFSGEQYEYIDDGLVNGQPYWYRLESIELDLGSQLFDPVRAIVGATPTPTLILAATSTNTITPTSTFPLIFLTSTPTLTPSPTNTATSTTGNDPRLLPGTGTPYPYPYPDPSLLRTQNPTAPLFTSTPSGPTATLIPFPTVTILFPPAELTESPLALESPESGGSSIGRLLELWPFGLLAVVWLAIAAWFYFSNRNLD